MAQNQKYKLDISSSLILASKDGGELTLKRDLFHPYYQLDDAAHPKENLKGKRDILALGLLFSELLLGSGKWEPVVDWKGVQKIRARVLSLNKYSNSLRSLVISMLDENPDMRPLFI